MQQQIHIAPKTGFVSVDGVGYDKLDLASLAVPSDGSSLPREVPFADAHMVIWDGRDGTIQRKSVIPGKFDVSHFADPAPLEPFVALWQVEHTRRLEAAEDQVRVAAEIDNQIFDNNAAVAKRAAEAAKVDAEVSDVLPV